MLQRSPGILRPQQLHGDPAKPECHRICLHLIGSLHINQRQLSPTPPLQNPERTSSPTTSGLSTVAKAGIDVGAAVAALAILGLLSWVVKPRRSIAIRQSDEKTPDVASELPLRSERPPRSESPKEAHSAPVHEAYGIKMLTLNLN